MKRIWLALGLVVLLAQAAPVQESPQEADFKKRLLDFQKTGDMSPVQTRTIYEPHEDPSMVEWVHIAHLEAIIVRGINSIEFEEIEPARKDDLMKPRRNVDLLDGDHEYVMYPPPYKSVKVTYEKTIKHGSIGFSFCVGMRDGKLFVCGLKRYGK